MIELVDVSKYYVTEFGKHYVFRNVSLLLPPDRSIGVMGPNGAGKSTFLRLIAGADIPSEGTVLRSGRISPPMGLTPGLQGSLTAAENARFAGRIYGLDRDEIGDMIAYVRETANIGKYFDEPVHSYSAGMKQRVAFAINMSMNFDYYLFDEIGAGGDKDFRKMARDMVLERLRVSKFVMTSHRTRDLLEFCEAGIVIRDGELTLFDDINEAVKFYGGDEEDDDESTSERQERRKAREERRRLRGEKDVAPALAAPEEAMLLLEAPAAAPDPPAPQPSPYTDRTPDAGAAGAGHAGAEEAAQELRRQKREERRRARAATTGADAAGPEADAAAGAGLPAPQEPLAAELPEAAAPEPDSERDARAAELRGTRRQRREERQRLKAAPAGPGSADVPPPPAEPAVLVEPPSAEAGVAPAPAAEDPDAASREAIRAARRAAAEERRRQRRAEREDGAAAAGTAADTVAAEAEEPQEQPADAATEEQRPARRAAGEKRRRRERPSEDTLAPFEAPGSVRGAAIPEAATAVLPEEEIASGAPPQPDSAAATAALATRPWPSVDQASPAPQNGAPGELTGADRKLLLVRLLLRQERAQAKASRAARLLLQHLEAPPGESAQSRSGRAMLVKAAQDIAAAEAAAARALLEQALSGSGDDAQAAAPAPSAPSPLIPANRRAT